jgi:hypothetical protein
MPVRSATLVDAALQSFEAASAAVGVEVLQRSVAGQVVEFHVAGRALAYALTTVLPSAEDGPVALRVRAWDRAQSGIDFPVGDADLADLDAWRRHGPWVEVAAAGPLVMHQPYERMVGLLDGDEAVLFTDDAPALPLWERAAPLLHLFHWWLAERGLFVVHASAVGVPDAGALLVGPGGTGKSTSAMSCVGSTLGYVGDDSTVIGLHPAAHARALYLAAKLDRSHLPRVVSRMARPPRVANADQPADDKAMLVVAESDIARRVDLRALLLPRLVPGSDYRARRVSGAATLAALAPSTILQLPGAGAKHLAAMRELCATVPSYVLEMGAAGSPSDIPDVIADLIIG